MNYNTIYLIFLALFTHVIPSQNESSTSIVIPGDGTDLVDELLISEVYEAYDRCNFTLIAPRKIINPYRSDITNYVPQKPFGSFHLKCAACIAVANQISRIIKSFMNNREISQMRQNFINQNLSNQVTELCQRGFKNYDLRKCREYSIVTDKFKCTEHVKSNMDGGWTKKLRELCFLYTSHMDLDHISNIYVNNTDELSTNLCKGSGIFRDCQNLEIDPPSNLDELCDNCDC